MDDFFVKFLANIEQVGIVGFIGVASAVFIWALAKEHLKLGKDYRKLDQRCDSNEKSLVGANSALAEARVLTAAATVRIEFLERDNVRLETEMGRLGERIASLEVELRRMRETWQPMRSARRGEGT